MTGGNVCPCKNRAGPAGATQSALLYSDGGGIHMITAIVLIGAERGTIPDLAQGLLEIPEVAEVYSVAGEFDIVAILRVKAYEDMAEVVPGKLQRLDGLLRTHTMMAFQCYSRHDLERLFSVGYEEESQA